MSKEPAEIFERAAEDGFIRQVRHFLNLKCGYDNNRILS